MTDNTPVLLSVHAMATRFELVLCGDDAPRLRAAGEEALQEIERLDAQLSFYSADSEVNWINAHAANEPVKVEPRLFRLLQGCAELASHTDGAFDVTVAPLMRAWGFVGARGSMPNTAQLEAARVLTGMEHVHLNEVDFSVRFDQPGIEIDLGAIGKGYAIEQAATLLRELGVSSALLHGGTSTVHAIGAPPDQRAWRVAIPDPTKEKDQLDTVGLCDNSLSVSAIHSKSFTEGNGEFGHVIDPRTGHPAQATVAAVSGPSATACDGLSTALLVLGESGLKSLVEPRPGYAGLVAVGESGTRDLHIHRLPLGE